MIALAITCRVRNINYICTIASYVATYAIYTLHVTYNPTYVLSYCLCSVICLQFLTSSDDHNGRIRGYYYFPIW